MSPDEVSELTRLSAELSKLLEKIVNYPGSVRKKYLAAVIRRVNELTGKYLQE